PSMYQPVSLSPRCSTSISTGGKKTGMALDARRALIRTSVVGMPEMIEALLFWTKPIVVINEPVDQLRCIKRLELAAGVVCCGNDQRAFDRCYAGVGPDQFLQSHV